METSKDAFKFNIERLMKLEEDVNKPFRDFMKEVYFPFILQGVRDQVEYLFKISTLSITLIGILLGIGKLQSSNFNENSTYIIGIISLLFTAIYGVYIGIILYQKTINNLEIDKNTMENRQNTYSKTFRSQIEEWMNEKEVLEKDDPAITWGNMNAKYMSIVKSGISPIKKKIYKISLLEYSLDIGICLFVLSIELITMGIFQKFNIWILASSILFMIVLFFIQQKITNTDEVRQSRSFME